MKAKVNSEFDLPDIPPRLKTCCIALHLKQATENQLRTCRTCTPVAVLRDKSEIFRQFAFYRKLQTILLNSLCSVAPCGSGSCRIDPLRFLVG